MGSFVVSLACVVMGMISQNFGHIACHCVSAIGAAVIGIVLRSTMLMFEAPMVSATVLMLIHSSLVFDNYDIRCG